jgi:pimeloyl-ACP methyl ester carboxylesterase
MRVTAFLLCLATSVSVQTQDKFFDSNGVKIRYVEQGTGEPVLLIHGYTRSIESNWVDPGVFQNLARDHHVIAFDLRGHGRSDKPHDPAAYGGEIVQDALRLLDHLGIKQAHFVGYSLGGAIVAKLVTTHPERFITATLGGHSGFRNWRPEFDENAKKTAAELESDVPFRSLVISMTPSDEPKLSDEEIRARSAALAAENDVKALAAYQRGGSRELNPTDAETAAIKIPVLGVMGSLDGGVRYMTQLQTLLPSVKVVIIEGATHAGNRSAVRRPEFVNAIHEFIAAHPASLR